jgi:hypothetical protein
MQAPKGVIDVEGGLHLWRQFAQQAIDLLLAISGSSQPIDAGLEVALIQAPGRAIDDPSGGKLVELLEHLATATNQFLVAAANLADSLQRGANPGSKQFNGQASMCANQNGPITVTLQALLSLGQKSADRSAIGQCPWQTADSGTEMVEGLHDRLVGAAFGGRW